jgi:hypothetical protein
MVETDLQFSGLPHFGRFMTLADFENSDPGVKDRFNTRYDGNGNKIESYNDEVNKNVPSQEKASSFIPNLGVGAAAGVGYVGAAALAASLLSNPIGWGTLVVGGIIGGLAGFANKMQRYAALYDDLHIYTDTMRNVFISDGWESACCDYLDDEWIADGSGWNCLKEITRYKVNHICTEVPYGNMATLYIGKPDGRYHYKPLDAKSIQYYSQMTPILNKFALNKLTENLITPFLNSYEYKGSNLQYETTLYYDFIDSNKVVDIISGVESSSNKYQILFSNSIFKHPESLDSYKNAVKVIEPAIVNIFGTKGTLKEDIPDLSNLEISKEDKSSYRMSELGVSLRNNNIFILDSIKLENLINQSGGIDGRTIEISDSANNGIPITLDLANLTPGQVRELGYLNQDVIAFKSTGTTLRIANKNELSKYNINPLDGLPNGKTYIKLDDDKVIRTSSELFTNSLSFYDKDGMGTIVKLTRASSKNSLDFKFELQNNINRLFRIAQTEVPDKVSVWIGLVNDNSDDLKFIQDTLSASGDSFLKYLFCYFCGIKKTELKDGTTSIKFSLNNRDFGNLDELAVEFTRALMDGTKFSRGVDEISGGNTTKSAEEEVINFNRYISEMVRSYTYGTDKTINYGSIKDSGEKIDIDIAKQVFGDNLIDAIEQGFLSNDELSRYISNAESIINNVVPDSKLPTEVKEAKNNARERASTQSVSNNEISSNDSDSIGDVIMFNADKYKLFLIFLAKFLRANPDIASGSRGISATIDWLSESIPPDQKNFRKTHIILSGVDIVENNITASLSQMHNNVLLFGPKDIEVKSSGEEETEENNIWTVDEAETTWVPFPNFSQSGVDFNPYVSPETRKQLQVRERNAETDTQKAALLINHLAEAMRPMYRGNIKVIGRHIKPYDLLLIIDQHNDMMGFVEVERVVHNFSATEGWITTVTPHAYVVPIDEVQNVAARFSTKTLELMLFGIRVLDTAFNIAMFYSIFAAPLNKAIGKAITNIGTSAAAATVKGTVTTDIAGKSAKGFIRDFLYSKLEQQTWFKAYVTEATSQLAGHNVSAEVKQQLIRRNAVKLFVESNSDWMAKGEIMKALGSSALEGLGLPKLAMAYLGRDIIYDGFSAYTSMVTECQIASTILPIHVFCLTKNARVFSAGLDTKLSNYYNYSDRIGYSINSARSALNNTLYGLFTTESNGGRGSNLTSPSSVLGPR